MSLIKLFESVTPVVLIDTNGNAYNASGGGGGGGDASAANQVLEIAELQDINAQTASIDSKIVAVDTGAVVVASSALPTGAASESTLSDIDTKLAGVIDVDTGLSQGLTDAQLRASPVPVSNSAGESFIGVMGGVTTNPTASFTRPSDTNVYASGDLVANNTTAGSVVAMSLTVARVTAGSFILRRVKLHKSGVVTTNASFRVHFFRATPGTITNGDNGVFSVSGVADYIGAMDVSVDRAFTDGAVGFGIPLIGSEMSVKLASGTTIVALLEARAAYTPISAEVFTLTLEDFQD